MRTVILYATNTSTTEKCALYLKNKIGFAKCYNVENLPDDFHLDDFDNIYLGINVRYFHFHKAMKKFIRKNRKTLKCKRVFGYIVGMNEAKSEKRVKKFQKMTGSKVVTFVGGLLDETGCKTDFDRQAVLMLKSRLEAQQKKLPSIHYELLNQLAECRNQKY